MQRTEFKEAIIGYVREWCPHDECYEYDEMTLADLGAFWLHLQIRVADIGKSLPYPKNEEDT